jgi:hypothetical protein
MLGNQTSALGAIIGFWCSNFFPLLSKHSLDLFLEFTYFPNIHTFLGKMS